MFLEIKFRRNERLRWGINVFKYKKKIIEKDKLFYSVKQTLGPDRVNLINRLMRMVSKNRIIHNVYVTPYACIAVHNLSIIHKRFDKLI